ncbi:unnamed protein product [Rhizoctonia solani]|uniref:DUF6535 domain-containing protein n=1 Tax=Rhizoctonia solani TaxID=456999 RepID=A0A8H3ATR0_9AGAM|nr:unnamed protein product [Rhizoctonia solani]
MPPPRTNHPKDSYNTDELSSKRQWEPEVEYDEYGAEMGPDARVWRVYVDETNKADKELVEGWNRAIDVMLVFAALFSAILTAFVIESSKDLKPDYAEISARALLAISKAMLTPEVAPADNETRAPRVEPSEFVPTRSAVVVNMLWFLSLGLSIAVTLIAILAKEWCYAFMKRRTGTKLTQGRLRQKRWSGIKRWKMEEIISTLPLLMHTSLLLFAVGLLVYLWNINPYVSLPVLITTALTVLYYIVTVFLSLLSNNCPYKTVIVKLFHPLWTAVFKSVYSRGLFQILIIAPASTLLFLLSLKDRISGYLHNGDNKPDTAAVDSTSTIDHNRFEKGFRRFKKKFNQRVEEIHKDFLVDSSGPGEDETPMDKKTSAMLLWMITDCEDPKSVELALKALAGADLWLPCTVFLEKEIDTQILRKLERCLYVLENFHLRGHGFTQEELIDSAYLYIRALATLIRARDNPATKAGTVSWGEWENCMTRLRKIPDIEKSRAFNSTRSELGALLLHGSATTHTSSSGGFPSRSEQSKDQWQLIEQISSNTHPFAGFPPSPAAVRTLVNMITQTLLYAPKPSLPLVRLLNAYDITPGNEHTTLGHAIGIALTIARFTSPRYQQVTDSETGSQFQAASVSSPRSRSEHVRVIYHKLCKKKPKHRRTRALLTFGLLGLLDLPKDTEYHSPEEIQSIHKALQTLETAPKDPKDPTIMTHEDRYLRYLEYHKLMPRVSRTFDLETQFKTIFMNWFKVWVGSNTQSITIQNPSEEPIVIPNPGEKIVNMHLEALLSFSRCRLFGSVIVDYLIPIAIPPENIPQPPNDGLSLEARKLCLRSIAHSVTVWLNCSNRQKIELQTTMEKIIAAKFHTRALALINSSKSAKGDEGESTKGNEHELVPYAMRFLWNFTAALINNFHSGGNHTLPNQQYSQVAGVIFMQIDNSHRISPSRCTSVRDVGFEAQWFNWLSDLCKEQPQNVLDSGILDELIDEKKYKFGRHKGANNRMPDVDDLEPYGVSSDEHASMTWPEIYRRLKLKYKEKPIDITLQGDKAEIIEEVVD